MVKVVYIRHSQTYFNVEKKAQKQKQSGIEKQKLNYYFQTLRDLNFVDSDLTPEGIEITKQALEINQSILNKIKYVIVSPMIRALNTADLLFDLKSANPNLKVIVHPSLRTKLTTIYNLPFKWIDKKEELIYADWSLLDPLYEKSGFGWFGQDLQNLEYRNKIGQICEESKEMGLNEQVFKVLDYMQQIHPCYAESREEKYFKMIGFQKWLAGFIDKNKVQDGELCVVSHSSVLKMLIAKAFNYQFLPVKTQKLANTELVVMDLNESFLLHQNIN